MYALYGIIMWLLIKTLIN